MRLTGLVLLAAAVAVTVATVKQLPDIKRYMKMRSM